jgi:DNA modification methylase
MSVRIINADVFDGLAQLADESVHCCVTSPPYWGLRDYGVAGQIGLEPTPEAFIEKMVAVFREVRCVLRKDGTLWVNIGDSYSHGGCGSRDDERWPKQSRNDHQATHAKKATGLKAKDLVGIPWMLAFALRADGWWLRQEIIWHKPNPMPESVNDRCTKGHEHIFLLSKSTRYFYDLEAIKEDGVTGDLRKPYAPGQVDARGNGHARGGGSLRDRADTRRNKRSVWTIATQPYAEAHFATFPEELPETCIKAGCPIGGVVLDPFGGAGTTGLVADKLGRHAVLIELNPEYAAMAERRIRGDCPMFAEVHR